MKLNKIALAVATVTLAPLASAAVTVTPLVGYHGTSTGTSVLEDTQSDQQDVYKVGQAQGMAQLGDLYTGVALGIDITPSTQFQVEYGVSNSDGTTTSDDDKTPETRFDVEQEMISGNFLVGASQFTKKDMGRFDPYVLIGAGQSRVTAENQAAYAAANETQSGVPAGAVPAGTEVVDDKSTIGNLGLGAMVRINDALSLRGEGRAVYNVDNKWWEGMALGGLQVKLGGKKAPVAPMPVEPVEVDKPQVVEVIEQVEVDTDRDGVIDARDACPGTPINLVVDARGCPRQVNIDDQLKMELRVFFDNDKTVIKEQYKPEIAKVAQGMSAYPNSVARIEGHASKTGPSARYNQRLSEARAVAVKSMLTNEFGINPSRITTKGFGYSRPIAPNDTAEGRAMNRRVYAIITGQKTVTVDQTKDMVK